MPSPEVLASCWASISSLSQKNMTKFQSTRKPANQGGFILGYVLLGIVLISVVIAALARANASASPTGGTEANKMYANTVVKIGNDLRDAATRYASDRDIAAMTMDAVTGTGLYDPALSLSTEVTVPAKATAAGGTVDAHFAFDKSDIVVSGMGTAAAEPSITVSGLSDGVCRAINNVLFSDSVTLALPTAVGIRQEGCAALTTPAGNTYYKVIQPG